MFSSPRRARRVVSVAAVAAATVVTSFSSGALLAGTAYAHPAPGAEDLAELGHLSEEAGALGEEIHQARDDLDRARAEQGRTAFRAGIAEGRAAAARGRAAGDQETVDSIANLRYRGGDTDPTRGAVMATSPRNLVDRMGVLQVLSGATTTALDSSRVALDDADRLGGEARTAADQARVAADDAQRRSDDLDTRQRDMDARMAEVRARVDALSEQQRQQWQGGPLTPQGYRPPAADGINGAALAAGLSKLGSPYSWGATGPNEFDCSGLMVWSYAQAGKALPRSSQAQGAAGQPVARADIQPGDIVTYFSGATHVGMYAGDGMVLHAPDYGIPVKLEKVDAMPINAIRRY